MNLLTLIEEYKSNPEEFYKDSIHTITPTTFFAYIHLIREGKLEPLEECLNTNLKLRLQLDIINILNLNESDAIDFIEQTGENIARYLCLNRCPDRSNCPYAIGQGYVNIDNRYPAGFEYKEMKVEIVPIETPNLYEIHRIH
jgi:hypothetical protein